MRENKPEPIDSRFDLLPGKSLKKHFSTEPQKVIEGYKKNKTVHLAHLAVNHVTNVMVASYARVSEVA